MNKESLKNVLLSELFSANSYLERLFHALFELKNLDHDNEISLLLNKLYFDITDIVEMEVLKDEFTDRTHRELNARELRTLIKANSFFFESLAKINKDEKASASTIVRYINTLYSYAHEFHLICKEKAQIDVQLPRPALAKISEIDPFHGSEEDFEFEVNEMAKEEFTPFTLGHLTLVHSEPEEEEYIIEAEEYDDEDDEVVDVPFYFLEYQDVISTVNSGRGVLGIDEKRTDKYEILVKEGHEGVYKKDYDKALEKFFKASELDENGEILTLIAWVYSLQGKNELSKSYCLKAIKKDPDYGPPYNDLGSLLLNEGHIKESLKWFSLAKKAVKYQNREYPYINAGRAYMMLKSTEEAILEFEKAVKLAPFNEELKKTVEKIKDGLLRDSGQSFDEDPLN